MNPEGNDDWLNFFSSPHPGWGCQWTPWEKISMGNPWRTDPNPTGGPNLTGGRMSRTVKREGDEIAKESIRANSDGTTTITVEIPGVPKANVKVTVDVVQGVKWLTVTATRASGKKYVNLWQIDGVNSDDITASCEDGLLTINVPSLKKVKNGTHNINVA